MLLTNQNYIILLIKSQSQFYMIIVSYILKFIISILKIPWKNEENTSDTVQSSDTACVFLSAR